MSEVIANLELHLAHQMPNDQDPSIGSSWDKQAWEEIFDHGNETDRDGTGSERSDQDT